MRLYVKYVPQYCLEPVHIIVQQFNHATRYKLTEKTCWNYVGKLKVHVYVATQKQYLSRKNLNPRVLWDRTCETWALKEGLCAVHERVDFLCTFDEKQFAYL